MRVRQCMLAGGVKNDGGKNDWGEAEAVSYAFTPGVFFFCIYETLSTLKVKDQRRESKAFSEWGAEIQGDVLSMWGSLTLLCLPPLFTVTHSVMICNTSHQNVSVSFTPWNTIVATGSMVPLTWKLVIFRENGNRTATYTINQEMFCLAKTVHWNIYNASYFECYHPITWPLSVVITPLIKLQDGQGYLLWLDNQWWS